LVDGRCRVLELVSGLQDDEGRTGDLVATGPLPYDEVGTEIVNPDEPMPGTQAVAEAEAGVSVDLASAANDQLETIMSTLEASALVAVTQKAVELDPDAIHKPGC